MRATDTDIFHNNLWGIVAPDGHFFIFLQVDHILVIFFLPIFNLVVLKFSVRRFKLAEIQKRVRLALVCELVGQRVLAQFAGGLVVSVELAVLVLAFA
jgi:hypothetical protein